MAFKLGKLAQAIDLSGTHGVRRGSRGRITPKLDPLTAAYRRMFATKSSKQKHEILRRLSAQGGIQTDDLPSGLELVSTLGAEALDFEGIRSGNPLSIAALTPFGKGLKGIKISKRLLDDKILKSLMEDATRGGRTSYVPLSKKMGAKERETYLGHLENPTVRDITNQANPGVEKMIGNDLVHAFRGGGIRVTDRNLMMPGHREFLKSRSGRQDIGEAIEGIRNRQRDLHLARRDLRPGGSIPVSPEAQRAVKAYLESAQDAGRTVFKDASEYAKAERRFINQPGWKRRGREILDTLDDALMEGLDHLHSINPPLAQEMAVLTEHMSVPEAAKIVLQHLEDTKPTWVHMGFKFGDKVVKTQRTLKEYLETLRIRKSMNTEMHAKNTNLDQLLRDMFR